MEMQCQRNKENLLEDKKKYYAGGMKEMVP